MTQPYRGRLALRIVAMLWHHLPVGSMVIDFDGIIRPMTQARRPADRNTPVPVIVPPGEFAEPLTEQDAIICLVNAGFTIESVEVITS